MLHVVMREIIYSGPEIFAADEGIALPELLF